VNDGVMRWMRFVRTHAVHVGVSFETTFWGFFCHWNRFSLRQEIRIRGMRAVLLHADV